MNKKQIEKIREKEQVSFDELCKHNSFEQILGKNCNDFTPEERKRRWDKVMSLDRRMKRYWNDNVACNGCIHLEGYWCKLEELPCSVNPILSFRYSMTGLACCGAGRVQRELELFEEDEAF
jgi:hypothetical protein